MLPDFIIDELRKRERRRDRRPQPVVQVPSTQQDVHKPSRNSDESQEQRGVVVISLFD